MRILLVASSYDPHTMRWIQLFQGTGWDIHVFDRNNLIHPDLRDITVHTGWYKTNAPDSVKIFSRYPFSRGRYWLEHNLPKLWNFIVPPGPHYLLKIIKKLKPDIIHVFGSNPYGYWLMEAIRNSPISIPWIYTSMGNDLFFWGQFSEHADRLREFMNACPFYTCECPRDLHLAEVFGFQGKFLGYMQALGGFNIDNMQKDRQPGIASNRRIIAVKGLHDHRCRALMALKALTMCTSQLEGYKILFFQTHPEVREAIKDINEEMNLDISIFERASPSEFYKLLGCSRLVVGVNLSDGIPNAMLEGMIMGAFPIQTNPGGATEYWIQDGYNGLLIPPENPIEIASAIKRALADDELVDSASETNLRLTQDRLEFSKVQRQMLTNYKKVAASLHKL